MCKLIVSNFVTLDGYYEGKDKSINSLYDYYHEDYSSDDSFDFYNAERLRAPEPWQSAPGSWWDSPLFHRCSMRSGWPVMNGPHVKQIERIVKTMQT